MIRFSLRSGSDRQSRLLLTPSLLLSLLLQSILDFGSQLLENRIVWGRIVVSLLTLIHQRNVYQGHQRNGMITLPALIGLRISVVAVGNELGGSAIIDLFFAVYCHLYLLVIDVQPYM